MKPASLVLVAAFGLCAAGPALAHHSGAMYDRTRKVTVMGVVKDFQYTQPHSWIDLVSAEGSGKTVEWSFEAGAPGQMKGAGITPSVLKVGDKITVVGYPLKDGRPGGAFLELTLPDGKVLSTGRKADAAAVGEKPPG